MEITIRPAAVSDAAECLKIYKYYINETTVTFEEQPPTVAEFEERILRITKDYPFLIAESAGKTVGYAYLDKYNERSAYRFAADLSVYLDRDFRGAGTGSKLLAAIENEAKTKGIKNIISIITEENVPSVNFHEKRGFIKRGCMQKVGFKFGKWLDVLFYQKAL